MVSLTELRDVLCEAALLERSVPFRERYGAAVQNPRVREILELETPKIGDFTKTLRIENGGKLYVVRMDLTKGVDNHKKHVVAGLILRGVLQGQIPREGIDTLIDGGNFNSAKALKHYAERFGMQGMYVMSRLFPQHVLDLLRSETFEVVQAPQRDDMSIETEFYSYLIGLMSDSNFRRNKFCLLHAKYGGEVTYPLGREIAKRLPQQPDYVVSCLGAGSTLEGLQIPIQDHFAERGGRVPRIIVAEHKLSPLFVRFLPTRLAQKHLRALEDTVVIEEYAWVEGLPHIAIGPHYQEINPLLSKGSIDRVYAVTQYSERDWQTMQQYLRWRGISVGNTSAANISIAARLANEGHSVVTVAFEPFREFYRKPRELPWLCRWETPLQKAALVAATAAWTAAGIVYTLGVDPNAPAFPIN